MLRTPQMTHRPLSAALATAAFVAAGPASATVWMVNFQGEIDDPASSGLEAGDVVIGSFVVDDNPANDPGMTGNHAEAVTALDLFLLDVSESGGFPTIVNQPDGDVFVSSDEFDLYYGPDLGQLGDNFGLLMTGSSVAFNNSLADAMQAMANAGDPLSLFGDRPEGFIQNDDTFEELFFFVDTLSLTVVPEPASAGLLALGAAMVVNRRRRA